MRLRDAARARVRHRGPSALEKHNGTSQAVRRTSRGRAARTALRVRNSGLSACASELGGGAEQVQDKTECACAAAGLLDAGRPRTPLASRLGGTADRSNDCACAAVFYSPASDSGELETQEACQRDLGTARRHFLPKPTLPKGFKARLFCNVSGSIRKVSERSLKQLKEEMVYLTHASQSSPVRTCFQLAFLPSHAFSDIPNNGIVGLHDSSVFISRISFTLTSIVGA